MNKKRIILAILCILGLALSVELAVIFYKNNFLQDAAASFCSISSTIDCDGVAKTPYAMFLGVPLALWGFLLYSILSFLVFVDFLKTRAPKDDAKGLLQKIRTFLVTLFPNPLSYIAALGILSFSISLILAGISIFKIQKICALCFVTYFIDLTVALVAKTKGSFFFADIKNTFRDFLAGVKKLPVIFAIVVISGVAILVYTSTSYIFSPNMLKMKSMQEFQALKENPWPISGNVLGKEGAKVQIYVYSDFLCPYCRITNFMMHKLAHEENDVEVHAVNFPLDGACNPLVHHTIHSGACQLAKYALAAKNQGKYWDMSDAIYNELPRGEEQVLAIAVRLGLDIETLKQDAHSEEISEILATQISMARNSFVTVTPSTRVNGVMYLGGMTYPDLKKAVKGARNKSSRK
jgi:protein-disulfide isomerase/uncharacterized membrane protein